MIIEERHRFPLEATKLWQTPPRIVLLSDAPPRLSDGLEVEPYQPLTIQGLGSELGLARTLPVTSLLHNWPGRVDSCVRATFCPAQPWASR